MNKTNMLSIETEDSFSSLLEFAANDDVDSFRRSIELDLSSVDESGVWFIRKKGSKLITQEQRTPLMVAATYGSIHVLKLIVALPEVDLNRGYGNDKWTPLHCAAFGGSVNAIQAVKLLLSAGADPNVKDPIGHRPIDVIIIHPSLNKSALEDVLMNDTSTSSRSSPVLSSSTESLSMSPRSPDLKLNEKKQYPVDPSIPDIRNSIYSSDEFRMFSFKVRPCSRAYSHDWTECPFVHPGENARRRDPRKYHYSCVPCPEFRKGSCRRGDMCEYAHGVFECWLHPAQYRTRLCKDGTGCSRQVCFFAHTHEDLRPLYVSTGSGVPSPRSSGAFMDMALLPNSPTSQTSLSVFSQTLSPNNGMPHPSVVWPQPNVPTLNLPGSNPQSSRLRSSLSARDIPVDDFGMLHDPSMMSSLAPSNLEELFLSENKSSPRAGFFSPTRVMNQFQHQQQSVLSPINTSNTFCSPRNMEHPLLQASRVSSPRMMSPRSMEAVSPLSTRLSTIPHHGSPTSGVWSNKWGPTNGKADWSVGGGDQACLKRSVEFGDDVDEPDVSWVQSLVKDSSPPEMEKGENKPLEVVASSDGEIDHEVLGGWLEQMKLDRLVV